MDSLLCWNVRGLNGPNKQRETRCLCNRHETGLVGLLETKIKANKIEQVEKNMFSGWGYITNLEKHYNGRIWLTWKPEYFQVPVQSMIAQAITCKVIHTTGHRAFLLKVVYAYNNKEERKELWSYMNIVHQGCQLPWLIFGDFNSVLQMDDRIGGNPITTGEMVDFQDCVNTCEWIELPQQGSRHME